MTSAMAALREGERDLERRVLVLRRSEHACEREEGHDRQVLEEQRPEGEPPVRAVELVLFRELAEHDRGRGHRDRAAEQDRDGERQAEGPGDRGDRGRGRGDLDAAEPEHFAARGEHPRQREFETEREEQEDDAEFGERAGRFRRRDPAERVGPDDHADQQECQDQRQPQAAQADDDRERRREQQQDVFQYAVFQARLPAHVMRHHRLLASTGDFVEATPCSSRRRTRAAVAVSG